jgi:hypothetical protein
MNAVSTACKRYINAIIHYKKYVRSSSDLAHATPGPEQVTRATRFVSELNYIGAAIDSKPCDLLM